MTSNPIVLIPADSPVLETLARAIEEGAAEESGSAPQPPVYIDTDGSFALAPNPGFVIVGWRTDQTPSDERVGRTFATLANSQPGPIRVVFFEASLRGTARSSRDVVALVRSFRGLSNLSVEGAVESFAIDRGPRGEFIGPLELARARRWGSTEYSRWRGALATNADRDSRADSEGAAPRSVPWCGATE